MANVPNWVSGDLKAPVPGIGKGGRLDPSSSEPVYHTRHYVPPAFVYLAQEDTIDSQWWRGSKMFLKVLTTICDFTKILESTLPPSRGFHTSNSPRLIPFFPPSRLVSCWKKT